MAVPDGAPDEVPALRHLMSAYFHQDFHAAYGGVWETLDAFAGEVPAEFSRLPQEIAVVLHRSADEAQVEAYVVDLGCEYLPEGGYRAWLEEIARRAGEGSA